MITKYKIFENEMQDAKYSVDDYVYVITDDTKKKCKIKEVIPKSDNSKFNFYIVEEYPYIQIREDQFTSEMKVDTKKYNL